MASAGSKPKRDALELEKVLNARVCVRLNGRDVTGVLKGYDALANLVLDDCVETLHDEASNTTRKRTLGLVVCRGTQVQVIHPEDGTTEIANPFVQEDEEM